MSILVLWSCKTYQKLYELRKMEDFNVEVGNNFIKKIQQLPEIHEISIVDTRADGNDFIVNRQLIFLDSNQINQPNYYSYKKRASELKISSDSLQNCLNTFYKIGVNEFNRNEKHLIFPVINKLNSVKGYIYSENETLQLGDTLQANSMRNKSYNYQLVLTRKINTNWFEYYKTLK
ncbi:MAG: hypothetical protein KF732_04165 [Flavobacteriales bacterium]|nr:hypothetical protein [Flavobacteriales bacterium]